LTIEFSVEDGLEPAEWHEHRIGSLVTSIVARELPSVSDWNLGLHLVRDETIRSLNREHRARDARTDVLSFPLYEAGFVLPPGEPVHLGDVVIAYSRAVEQARELGHSVDREIGYLTAHGVLHILGYDHEHEPDQVLMRAKEEEALRPLGLTR